jgi:hypothetical protein
MNRNKRHCSGGFHASRNVSNVRLKIKTCFQSYSAHRYKMRTCRNRVKHYEIQVHFCSPACRHWFVASKRPKVRLKRTLSSFTVLMCSRSLRMRSLFSKQSLKSTCCGRKGSEGIVSYMQKKNSTESVILQTHFLSKSCVGECKSEMYRENRSVCMAGHKERNSQHLSVSL